MKYLIFDNETNLNDRNNQIAKDQGCDINPYDGTKYWFISIKHPTQNQWALCVDDETTLTEQEKSSLKNYDELLTDGWFEI